VKKELKLFWSIQILQLLWLTRQWPIIYLKPLTTKSIIEILKAHPQIDAVLPTMGGQTALNLCLKQMKRNLGWFYVNDRGYNAINITEDREQFKHYLKLIPSAPAEICTLLRGKRKNLVFH
jgi:carbamoyl-phosphate synthase large subunit